MSAQALGGWEDEAGQYLTQARAVCCALSIELHEPPNFLRQIDGKGTLESLSLSAVFS